MEEGVSRQEFNELKDLVYQQQQTIAELQSEADFFKRGLTNFIDEQLQQKGTKAMDMCFHWLCHRNMRSEFLTPYKKLLELKTCSSARMF